MQEIGTVFPAWLKRHLQGQAPPVVEILAPFWHRVVGKAMAQESRPVAFAAGTLALATACPSWAAQLDLMEAQIRAQINGFLGGPVVKKLRVRYAPEVLAKTGGNSKLETGSSKLETGNWKLETENSTLAPELPFSNSDFRNALGSELANVVEQSFVKYFSRSGVRNSKAVGRDS